MSEPDWDDIKARLRRGERITSAERRYALTFCDALFSEALRQGRHRGDRELLDAAREGRAMLRFLSGVTRVPHMTPDCTRAGR